MAERLPREGDLVYTRDELQRLLQLDGDAFDESLAAGRIVAVGDRFTTRDPRLTRCCVRRLVASGELPGFERGRRPRPAPARDSGAAWPNYERIPPRPRAGVDEVEFPRACGSGRLGLTRRAGHRTVSQLEEPPDALDGRRRGFRSWRKAGAVEIALGNESPGRGPRCDLATPDRPRPTELLPDTYQSGARPVAAAYAAPIGPEAPASPAGSAPSSDENAYATPIGPSPSPAPSSSNWPSEPVSLSPRATDELPSAEVACSPQSAPAQPERGTGQDPSLAAVDDPFGFGAEAVGAERAAEIADEADRVGADEQLASPAASAPSSSESAYATPIGPSPSSSDWPSDSEQLASPAASAPSSNENAYATPIGPAPSSSDWPSEPVSLSPRAADELPSAEVARSPQSAPAQPERGTGQDPSLAAVDDPFGFGAKAVGAERAAEIVDEADRVGADEQLASPAASAPSSNENAYATPIGPSPSPLSPRAADELRSAEVACSPQSAPTQPERGTDRDPCLAAVDDPLGFDTERVGAEWDAEIVDEADWVEADELEPELAEEFVDFDSLQAAARSLNRVVADGRDTDDEHAALAATAIAVGPQPSEAASDRGAGRAATIAAAESFAPLFDEPVDQTDEPDDLWPDAVVDDGGAIPPAGRGRDTLDWAAGAAEDVALVAAIASIGQAVLDQSLAEVNEMFCESGAAEAGSSMSDDGIPRTVDAEAEPHAIAGNDDVPDLLNAFPDGWDDAGAVESADESPGRVEPPRDSAPTDFARPLGAERDPALAEIHRALADVGRKHEELHRSVDRVGVELGSVAAFLNDAGDVAAATADAVSRLYDTLARDAAATRSAITAAGEGEPGRISVVPIAGAVVALCWALAAYLHTGSARLALGVIVMANVLACAALIGRVRMR